MSKRAFRSALAVVVGTFVLLLGVGMCGWHVVASYPSRKHDGKGKEVPVEIVKGMKFPEVVARLQQAKLIDRPSWFRFYAMHRGLANRVRAGKYVLRDNLTPAELLDTLVKGVEEIEVSVTIPEGRHLGEVCELIAQAGVAEAAAVERLAREPARLAEQGIAGETVEGYLFPNTYRFKKPSAPKAVLEAMVKQHRIEFDKAKKEHEKHLRKLQKQLEWGDREVVIMASIVEKE